MNFVKRKDSMAKTGFYVQNGVAFFMDCNTEEESYKRMTAELEHADRIYQAQYQNDQEALRTDNWDINHRFTRHIKPEHPNVINYGLRINKLGTRGRTRLYENQL